MYIIIFVDHINMHVHTFPWRAGLQDADGDVVGQLRRLRVRRLHSAGRAHDGRQGRVLAGGGAHQDHAPLLGHLLPRVSTSYVDCSWAQWSLRLLSRPARRGRGTEGNAGLG